MNMEQQDIEQMLAVANAEGHVSRRAARDSADLHRWTRRRYGVADLLFLAAVVAVAAVALPSMPAVAIFTSRGYSPFAAYHTALQTVDYA